MNSSLPSSDILKIKKILEDFSHNYLNTGMNFCSTSPVLQEPLLQKKRILQEFIDLVLQQYEHPYEFPVLHEPERTPYDYYAFGMRFINELIDQSKSRLRGVEIALEIVEKIERGENVILLANHQTEADPQILSFFLDALLSDKKPTFAEKILFLAGHRVTTDPLAVPFSRGRRLLCIYSKRHLEHPIELKEKKLAHNQKAIASLHEQLLQGGVCVYVAPSGGRDRPDENGQVFPAPFADESVGIMNLLAQQATKHGKKTSLHPLVLNTYKILPPPPAVEKEIGEKRQVFYAPVHLEFLPEVNILKFEKEWLETTPGALEITGKERRHQLLTAFTSKIWGQVLLAYQTN